MTGKTDSKQLLESTCFTVFLIVGASVDLESVAGAVWGGLVFEGLA